MSIVLLDEDNVSHAYTVYEDIQFLHFLLHAQICTSSQVHRLESIKERTEVIIKVCEHKN